MKKILTSMIVVMMVLVGGMSVISINGAEMQNTATDTTPPQVLSTTPVDASTAQNSTVIEVIFSEPMDQSATESAFSIYPAASGTFSWNTNGDTLVFNPDSGLTDNTTYRVTIDSSVACDLAGNLLDGNGNGVHDAADTWVTMTEMPTARAAPAASAVGDKIYVIGGNNGTRLSTVEIYDTINDTWTTGTPMPTARSGMGSAALNGKIYVMGGGDGNNVLSTLEIYDTASDTWSTGAPMPTARRGLVSVALNGRIFAMGGRDSGGDSLATVEIYDPENNTWSAGTPMTTDVAYGCAATANGRIYITGGSGSNPTNQEYNPQTDRWLKKADLPSARTDPAGAGVNGMFYVIGGYDMTNYAETSKNEEFDALRNVWATKGDMPTARWDPGTAVIKGKIYVLGGANSTEYLSKNEVYTPNDDYSWYFKTTAGGSQSGNTTALPQVVSVSPADGAELSSTASITVTFSVPMNHDTTEAAFSIYPPVNGTFSWNGDGNIMTFSPSTPFLENTTYRVTIDGSVASDTSGNLLDGNRDGVNNEPDTWATMADMPTARSSLTATAVGSKIYAIGGSNGNRLSTLEIYDTISDTWTAGSSMSLPRSGLASAEVNGIIYAIGGWDGHTTYDTVEAYDIANDTWSTVSSLPVPRRGLMAVSLNGMIYAIGGYDSDNNATNTFMRYDPVNDTWSMETPLNNVTAYGCAAVINGKIYVTAGTLTQEYNPANDTWTLKARRSAWRLDLSGGAVNGKMYAVGGVNSNFDEVSTNEGFNALANNWVSKTDMPTARYDPAGAVVNGKIYMLGGGNSNEISSKNEVYTPNDDYSWYFTTGMNSATTDTFSIPVHTGWNLISYPLSISGNIEDVFNDDVVWDYAQWYNPADTGDHWKTHIVGRTENDLNTIDNTMGIWLHVTDAGDGYINITGESASSTAIILHAGWNLVSYPGSDLTAMNATNLPSEVSIIARYDSSSTYLISEVTDRVGSNFVPGRGYWLYSTADTVWTVNY